MRSARLTLTDDLEQVLAASPDNGTVILLLADMYLWSGRRTDALALYERARSVDALWGPAIFAVANANYLYKGNRQRALALLDEMESLEPGNPQAANLRALMAFSEGRALEWDHWKAKAIELAPREPSLHGYLSHEYGYLGLLDAAMYHARVGHEANPESADGAYNMAHIYLFSGDVDAARPLVQRAMAEHSQDRLALFAQAELQYFTGDCGGAIRSLELADARIPEASRFIRADVGSRTGCDPGVVSSPAGQFRDAPRISPACSNCRSHRRSLPA